MRSPIVLLAVLAAALGYFVDAYDLILYNVVRRASLLEIGVSPGALLNVGVDMLNAQLAGMLLGGFFWGIWGDKRGRRSVLFGSILAYSLATVANGLVTSLVAYGACRFVAGIGLAGELGAGVTLVSEIMPPETRGFGTMIVASVGVVGVVTASLVGGVFPWRTAYFIGGALGILLLALRMGVNESGLFAAVREKKNVARGDLRTLFRSRARVVRYAWTVLVALPIWYLIAIPVTFAPEIGAALGLNPAPTSARAVLFYYIGLTFGDLASGWTSQRLRSRRRAMAGFLALTALCLGAHFTFGRAGLVPFYALVLAFGWSSGYWAVFITTSAELFGTNLRSTVATTAPNVVRGLAVPLTIAFKRMAPGFGAVPSAIVLGVVSIAVGAFALSRIEETFGRDLDFLEE